MIVSVSIYVLLLEEEIARLFNDSHSSVAASLSQVALGKLPHLVHRIENLDRVEIGRSVVTTHHIDHVVHHHGRGVSPRRVHIRDATPLPDVGVVPLDAASDVRTVVTSYSVQEIIHDGHSCTAPALKHGLDGHPFIGAGVVTLHVVEALPGDTVVTTDRKEVAVHDCHAHTGPARRHGSHVHPLLGV